MYLGGQRVINEIWRAWFLLNGVAFGALTFGLSLAPTSHELHVVGIFIMALTVVMAISFRFVAGWLEKYITAR